MLVELKIQQTHKSNDQVCTFFNDLRKKTRIKKNTSSCIIQYFSYQFAPSAYLHFSFLYNLGIPLIRMHPL